MPLWFAALFVAVLTLAAAFFPMWLRHAQRPKTVWLVRHQAAGIIQGYVFASEPTEAQIASLRELCCERHGAAHPKTPDEQYWMRTVEVQLHGTGVLKLANKEPPGGTVNASALGLISSHGTGVYRK